MIPAGKCKLLYKPEGFLSPALVTPVTSFTSLLCLIPGAAGLTDGCFAQHIPAFHPLHCSKWIQTVWYSNPQAKHTVPSAQAGAG